MSNQEKTAMPDDLSTPQAFMHSSRGRAGKPESSFFWLNIDGKACIAKVLTTEQGPHLLDFVRNEQAVLRLLREKGAPVCKLVDYPSHPEWLVTEFGGLSLHLLGGDNGADWKPLPIQEYVSVWAHFLQRAQILGKLNAVPLDLAGRNVVVPLGSSGQLKLSEAISIDHAHTVLPSNQLPEGALKRPIWIDPKSPHLAPELRGALKSDQTKLLSHLHELNVPRPDSTAGVAQGPDGLSARAWLEYSAPQDIQTLVNRGEADADKVIQFAVGYDIHRQLRETCSFTPALASVVQRLCATDPEHRYKKLEQAAEALKTALGGRLAHASDYSYRPNLPKDLVSTPSRNKSAPLIDLSQFPSFTGSESPQLPNNEDEDDGDDDGTILVPDERARPKNQPPKGTAQTEEVGQPATNTPKTQRTIQNWLWPLLAAALAVATAVPLGIWLASH